MSDDAGEHDQLVDFAPLVERAAAIDAATLVRLSGQDGRIGAYARLPYDVIAGATIAVPGCGRFDTTFLAADLLRWIDDGGPRPPHHDVRWLSPLPPREGWRRVETVPGSVVRELVSSGASLARAVPTTVAHKSLLGSVVLTASSGDRSVDVPLAALSALTRMGFLPRDSHAAIDVAPGWLRVAATYGSSYLATANALGLSAVTAVNR